jgi:hypothetical protein
MGNGASLVDWATLTPAQHSTAFALLRRMHEAVLSYVRIGEGHDNGALFALAADFNNTMHAGNDDLARREQELITLLENKNV